MKGHQGTLAKRIEGIDNNTRFLLKYQEHAIGNISKKVKGLEKLFKSVFLKEASPEEKIEENMTESEKLELAQIRRKKKDILNALNLQTSGQSLSIDSI
jgi:hypothetical protein